MIIGEAGVLVQSSDPQGGRDSAAPGSNNGAGDKNEDVMPGQLSLNGCIQVASFADATKFEKLRGIRPPESTFG